MDKPDSVTLVAIAEAVRVSLEELGYTGWEANILLIKVEGDKGMATICGQSSPKNIEAALKAKIAKGPSSGEAYMIVDDDPNTSKH